MGPRDRPTRQAPDGVLGIWDGHDAGVALVVEGRLAFALSEERPARVKRFSGYPRRAIAAALAWAEGRDVQIDHLALAGRWGRAGHRIAEPLYSISEPSHHPLGLASRAAMRWEGTLASAPGLRRMERAAGLAVLRARLRRQLGRPIPLHAVCHHEAHAFSALFTRRRRAALVATWDAFGGRDMATLRRADRPEVVVERTRAPWGLALLYGAVTAELGFGEGDEGKVTGLAARGDPDRLRGAFLALFCEGPGAPVLRLPLTRYRVRRITSGATRDDVAAGLQGAAEALAVGWLGPHLRRAPAPLVAAGGTFANVRINRALARLPDSRGVTVFPHMGDGGLAAGAAHRLWFEIAGDLADPLDSPALGATFDAGRARAAVEGFDLQVRCVDDPEAAAAAHLVAGRTVCRHTGRDEYGPRALGHRSILFSAADQALSAEVNRRLGRDGFMPFGPILRAEDAPTLLADDGADLTCMTAAVDARTPLRIECPAAVHIDGTTRPQVVHAATSPDLHRLLSMYADAGGGPAVINTSFNLHGEPIVHTPRDAVQTFVAADLDVLYLGDLEVRRRGSRSAVRAAARTGDPTTIG